MSSSSHKVIIVGGGPVGLTAAHALSRAGIDFTLLESRPSIVIDAGSNLVILPTGLRILSQLGLLETFNAASSPLGRIRRFDHEGNDIGDANFFVHYKENHGIAPRVVSRHDVTRVLHDSLPTSIQSRLLPNKRVSSIATTPSSVTVTCTDGSVHTGSMLIGADGAHSFVRSQMRDLALASDHTPASAINPAQPFLTTYRAMWIRFPTQADLTPGDANETHGRDCTIQTFVGEETSVIGMYERLPAPTQDRLRYSAADEEAFVARWGDLPLSGEVTVRRAYESRVQAGMVSLEEGVVPNWSWGRMVLVGDAAHKFTPSTGAGCNNGMVDVVALVNEIVRALEGGEDVERAFGEYQRARFQAVVDGCAGAGRATATATWMNGIFKFVDLHVVKRKAVQKMFMDRAAQEIASTPVLEFVEDGEFLAGGKVPWAQGGQSRVAMAA
ncbi:hypothetical protein B0T25DRAFT_290894 [Lasiosphaeria hispida]|uniref:FAD-binding domain-containing protein n=1 Tax=Lasiosphaeria hispida TaxID=260671 RepID=A0AAJ0MB58_9PEZI|nr:hypothetical protein B0T25DRAFT_290894 [Lasiosphaeria hispida]